MRPSTIVAGIGLVAVIVVSAIAVTLFATAPVANHTSPNVHNDPVISQMCNDDVTALKEYALYPCR